MKVYAFNSRRSEKYSALESSIHYENCGAEILHSNFAQRAARHRPVARFKVGIKKRISSKEIYQNEKWEIKSCLS